MTSPGGKNAEKRLPAPEKCQECNALRPSQYYRERWLCARCGPSKKIVKRTSWVAVALLVLWLGSVGYKRANRPAPKFPKFEKLDLPKVPDSTSVSPELRKGEGLTPEVPQEHDSVVASTNQAVETFKPDPSWTPYEEKYPNGQLKAKGYEMGTNANLALVGPQSTWYENGRRKTEWTVLQNGEQDGKSTMWYENGQLKSQVDLMSGVRHGLVTNWYENGQKVNEATFVNGKQDGKSTSWYENGQMKESAKFANGAVYGQVTTWHANGQKQSEMNAEHGKRHGTTRQWYSNGQLEYEAEFKEGELVGQLKCWLEDGHKAECQ